MDDARSESWKGFAIETLVFPVRHCALPALALQTYMAVVRIRRADQTLAGWHLPRYAQRWASADEAHRETVEYAIRAINTGCFDNTEPPTGVAA
ncbi:hypothetical protein [Paraburkholderia lycopersici]|uniref:Uncharacterized protein n=1 Tax=Paraburkholderia lycopersici TaxID=416944 RepID=A0A1G6QC05_9BURK|nr:hypothetical protein [Paraburkholderia lycopersici]SDC90020.1 hypothetical protein SAMN05421548_111167 [Paraburkholderia lycopersici]